MYVWMDGWMDGWQDGWMVGYIVYLYDSVSLSRFMCTEVQDELFYKQLKKLVG
jgi:hypothetical protein